MSRHTRRRTPHPVVTRLQRLREAAGYTRPAFAEKHGIPLTTIEKWEWGLVTPSLDLISGYAAALGYDLILAPREET